jgi:hypothetical protein
VSVELTNRFISEMAARRLFDLVAGDQVTEAMTAVYGNPRDWIFDGTAAAAAKIGRELKVDGVVFGQIKRYVQTHLDQSEFEVEFELIEISTLETVWTVRELMIGKGGSPGRSDVVTSPTTRELSERAVTGAVERVGEIYAAGGSIKVSTTSAQTIWGYSLLTVGAVTTVGGVYYAAMATQAYRRYQSANTAADLARYKEDTDQYDQMWMILLPAGLAVTGGGVYLLVTDPARSYAAGLAPTRFAAAPLLLPGGAALACYGQF